jgi:hypothetical protein
MLRTYPEPYFISLLNQILIYEKEEKIFLILIIENNLLSLDLFFTALTTESVPSTGTGTGLIIFFFTTVSLTLNLNLKCLQNCLTCSVDFNWIQKRIRQSGSTS